MLLADNHDLMHGADDGYMYGADDGYMYGASNLGRPRTLGAGPGEAVAIGIGGLIATALTVTNVLFTYGVARSHPDKMVRTTGYIISGLGVLSVLGVFTATAIGTAVTASKGSSVPVSPVLP